MDLLGMSPLCFFGLLTVILSYYAIHVWFMLQSVRHRRLEAERIAAIEDHRREWGETLCEVLIQQHIPLDKRTENIMAHLDEWGKDLCATLLQGKVELKMTEEMVRLAWGAPDAVEELTESGGKSHWLYEQGDDHTAQIWFTDGRVSMALSGKTDQSVAQLS